jgi:putative solute:sodium symporter small subunit
MKELQEVSKETRNLYWKKNIRLTIFTMVIWFIVTYVCAFFVKELNNIVILGFPFGYYMAAQGSLIVFVWLIFNYAFKMNKYDKEFGVEEEEEK